MKKRYCGEEPVFEFIWNNADGDGIWVGGAKKLATKFGVSEDESYAVLGELCDRNLIQRIGSASYIVTRWPEKNEPATEEEMRWSDIVTGLRNR